jgi:asparagine synthase (glutamine-hydrolysing)
MCGIVGAYGLGPSSDDLLRAELRRMADAIVHRGPDDQGVWTDAAAGIGLGHRRLSIIDLSPLGRQPMSSRSGRYTITFNGEIYNYRDLRAELSARGHAFRGSSDTEVLLAAIEQWGLREALIRSTGMFALGVWDRERRTLSLARDRFGEKPLYYGVFGRTVLFGSELKALREHAAWQAEVDRNALTLLLRHGFIPAPYSVFRQVQKVRPGHILCVMAAEDRFSTTEECYWSTQQQVEAGSRNPFAGAPQEAVDETERLLSESIRRQMVADVPVGAFLSGGIDSSLVVALMQRASVRPVRTFTIGFGERDFDEAPYARAVAAHLGTDHTELRVTPADAIRLIPELPRLYDEPFADASQIPTYFVSALARRSVTVSLSGDAGDELFGGYAHYLTASRRWQRLRAIPRPVRGLAASLLGAAPEWSLRALTGLAQLSRGWRGRVDFGDRLRERSRELAAGSAGQYFAEMNSYFHRPCEFVPGSSEPPTVATSSDRWPTHVDPLRLMMYQDTCQYMADGILVKVDRASMAVSLESRIPLLDPAVAQFAWRIPCSQHFADGRGKWILRQILERHVPKALIDRPKTGFSVPIGAWLRSDLRDWAESLLDPARIAAEGFFDPMRVNRVWQQHLGSPATDWSLHLWTLLMFQAWLAYWKLGARQVKPDHAPPIALRAAQP